MNTQAATAEALKGGGFLIEDLSPEGAFTPEDFSEEQEMLAQTGRDFMERDVLPKLA